MMHHLLNKVEEIKLLRGGGDGEEREQHKKAITSLAYVTDEDS